MKNQRMIRLAFDAHDTVQERADQSEAYEAGISTLREIGGTDEVHLQVKRLGGGGFEVAASVPQKKTISLEGRHLNRVVDSVLHEVDRQPRILDIYG
jgi:hypothetical protein